MVHWMIQIFQATTIILLGNDQKHLGNNKNISIIGSMVAVDWMIKYFWKTPKTFFNDDRKIYDYVNQKISITEFNNKKIRWLKTFSHLICLIESFWQAK